MGDHPHARGLPGAGIQRGAHFGIIPARAGFTRTFASSLPRSRDHPRSRGVYSVETFSGMRPYGSSPLARGLPSPPQPTSAESGIIPARAGFTPMFGMAFFRTPDHPRSRGVYARRTPSTPRTAGSSPLARGLLGIEQVVQVPARIIPARAGFTVSIIVSLLCVWDHPRSRGVYPGRAVACGGDGGSSPLARGLPLAAHRDDPGHGIIPARAGFTRMGGRRSSPTTDHPRSRGVYFMIHPAYRTGKGSSPLARGLREPFLAGLHEARIIPARAGFTGGCFRLFRGRRDHPRSRGVYRRRACDLRAGDGSSPLARGLRGRGGESKALRGIIPARAGFTGTRTSPGAREWDHPRSRGVYGDGVLVDDPVAGSSPLARGLRG